MHKVVNQRSEVGDSAKHSVDRLERLVGIGENPFDVSSMLPELLQVLVNTRRKTSLPMAL